MRRARKSRKPRTHVKPVVGTLVWIRRRNGSWWPGRIISTDELSSLHLTSQRSGTPVKLLGREDASVDWYNVEKSKRVKAFRCGEFDECIENAKALGGLSGRRREKYARREDAILDAIELEKKQLERMSCFSGTCSPERKGKSTVKQERHDGGLNSITSESSFNPVHTGDAGITSFRSLHKQENINALRLDVDLEDEGTESMPRMKGLHDLGMISDCPNTKKYERNGMSNGSCEASLLTEACTRPSPGNGAASNSSKSFSPWSKKKLTLNRCCEEGGLKRRDRRKPLTQVLESMTKLTMPVVTDGKLEKCDGLVLLQPMVGGPREVSFQPSIECGPLPSVVTDAAFLQEAAISLKDELKSPNLNSSSLGPLRQETSTACLVSTLACPEPLVCTTVRSRVLSSMRSTDKDYSLMSSSLSSPVSNACTFVTSACTCHSHLEGHFCKAMRGVCKQSSCLACSDSFSRGCEKSLGSKNISGLDSCRRIDGMSLRNGMPPVHKAVLFSDSSDAALEKGVTLSFKSCARDKTDDLMGVDNFLSNESSQWQEQELLTSTNHQDVTQSLPRGIQTMANKIDEASNTSLAKPMRPPLNKYCTRCTCWQDGSYSVCKRPKVGSQSTCMGRADVVSCEESKLVLESLEHAEGQKTLGRRIGNGGELFSKVIFVLL